MTRHQLISKLAVLWAMLPLAANAESISEGALLFTSLMLCLVLLIFLLTLHTAARRKLKLQRLRSSFNQLLAETSGIIGLLDRNLTLQNGSSALKRLIKVDNSTSIISPLSFYADASGRKSLDHEIKQFLRTDGKWQGEAWLVNEQSKEALKISIQALQPDKLRPAVYLMYGQNISDLRRENEQQLLQQLRDSDTLLPNQRLFDEQLSMTLQSCDEHFPTTAVIYVQLTPVKHEFVLPNRPTTADLIIDVTLRIQQTLPQKLLLARYKADSLAILVPPHLCDQNSTIYLNQVAHKVLASFSELDAEYLSKWLQVHLGVSVSPNDGNDAEQLIRSAERAAKKAATYGQHALSFADSGSQQQSPDYLLMEAELYRSAAQGDFELFYQPKYSVSSNRIIGFEALLRWPSPDRGMLPPPTFLPLVEETGLIVNLDRLAFRKACYQVQQWQAGGLMRGRIALNISKQQFEQPDFLVFMQMILDEFSVTAEFFELELPETIFAHPSIWLRERMHSLNRMGFKLILDNFGEGISSLTQLRQRPLHGIKLSPVLFRFIEQQEQQRNICATLIRLAGYLELEVTATNIETEMQAYLSHVMGCDKQQGYRFSRPLPASAIENLLAEEEKRLTDTQATP